MATASLADAKECPICGLHDAAHLAPPLRLLPKGPPERPKATREGPEGIEAMTIVKLIFAALFLFALHHVLELRGEPLGAHVITGAMACLIAVVIRLGEESLA